jgi:hypothetical protein
MRRISIMCSCVLLLAAGCSLGPREDWAEAIRDADAKAQDEGTARVRMSAAVKVIETVIRQEPVPLIARQAGTVDFADRVAVLTGQGEETTIFDDLVVFLPRSATSRVTGRQRWARFDFKRELDEEIEEND